MPNRCQSDIYIARFEFIAERDGPYCIVCFIESGQRRGLDSVNLQIDHADGNRYNWSPSNLHLVCDTHNRELRSLSSDAHVSRMATYSAENKSKRKSMNLDQSLTRRLGYYSDNGDPLKINGLALPKWRDYIYKVIAEDGMITKDNAIRCGANEAYDVDIQTTSRWYKKDTAPNGRFKQILKDAEPCLILNENYKFFANNGHRGNGHKPAAELKGTVTADPAPVAGREG